MKCHTPVLTLVRRTGRPFVVRISLPVRREREHIMLSVLYHGNQLLRASQMSVTRFSHCRPKSPASAIWRSVEGVGGCFRTPSLDDNRLHFFFSASACLLLSFCLTLCRRTPLRAALLPPPSALLLWSPVRFLSRPLACRSEPAIVATASPIK